MVSSFLKFSNLSVTASLFFFVVTLGKRFQFVTSLD